MSEPRCSDCGTALGELHVDAASGEWLCRRCYDKRQPPQLTREEAEEVNRILGPGMSSGGRGIPRSSGAPVADGVERLRALLAPSGVDITQTPPEAMTPLPGAPFMLAGEVAHLSGPSGWGKSQVAQIVGYEVARTGRVLYLVGGEVTREEFADRAREITEAREGKITEEAVKLWRSVCVVEIAEALPVIWAHAEAWRIVCRDFALIVLDPVSLAGAALGLDFETANADYTKFFQRFAEPTKGHAALLIIDNVGHGQDARDRAMGVSAKGHHADITLTARPHRDPLGLRIAAQKVRSTRAPFRRGAAWVAYKAGCQPAVPLDAVQAQLEAEYPEVDIEAAAWEALADGPLSQNRLVEAVREAGVRGRDADIRKRLQELASVPERRIDKTAGGYLRRPRPEPRPEVRPEAGPPSGDRAARASVPHVPEPRPAAPLPDLMAAMQYARQNGGRTVTADGDNGAR